MQSKNELPSGTLGLACFAFHAPVENSIQRLILFVAANCPDPSGGPGFITTHDYLAKYCITSIENIEHQINRMVEIGVLDRAKPYPDMPPDLVRFLCDSGG